MSGRKAGKRGGSQGSKGSKRGSSRKKGSSKGSKGSKGSRGSKRGGSSSRKELLDSTGSPSSPSASSTNSRASNRSDRSGKGGSPSARSPPKSALKSSSSGSKGSYRAGLGESSKSSSSATAREEESRALLANEKTQSRNIDSVEKHKFIARFKNIKVSGGLYNKPFVKFSLGGNSNPKDLDDESYDQASGGDVGRKRARNRRPKVFSTSSQKVKTEGGEVNWHKTITKSWKGAYNWLKNEWLKVEVYNNDSLIKNTYIGEVHINLLQLANGSIPQEHTLVEIEKKVSGTRYRNTDTVVSFDAYFQEPWHFELELFEWKGHKLRAGDTDGTSDPFMSMSFKPSLSKFFRSGGFFGRSLTSSTIYNTLNPDWETLGSITYYGLRADLENEILRVRVYDWDLESANDLLGVSNVPFRGAIDAGYLQIGLSYKPKRRAPAKEAGSISGYLRVKDLPYHNQKSQPVALLKGQRYLAVRVENCTRLNSKDKSGLADAFVSVRWGGIGLRTRTVHRNLNPKFEQILYFPVRLGSISWDGLEQLGDIKISVFDEDQASNDFLGACMIPLRKVVGGHRANPAPGIENVRTFSQSALPLESSGAELKSSVSITAWFQPELPKMKIPEADEASAATELGPELLDREKAWAKACPAPIAKALKPFAAKRDERDHIHLLPTYLRALEPMKGFKNPRTMSRMVHNIKWVEDSDAFTGKEDVWTNPNFFLDMRKGDAEEHAILLCNLFLGIGKDAYVACGQTTSGNEHTWVLTRERDGRVIHWETSTDKSYTIEGGWPGKGRGSKASRGSRGAGSAGSDEEDDIFEESGSRRRARAKKKKAAEAAAKRRKEAAKKKGKEKVTLFFDDDDFISAEEIVRDNEQFSNRTLNSSVRRLSSTKPRNSLSGKNAVNLPGAARLPYDVITQVFNDENIWLNLGKAHPALVSYDFSDQRSWNPFVVKSGAFGKLKPFFRPRRLGPPLSKGRVKALKDRISEEMAHGLRVYRKSIGKTTWINPNYTPVLEQFLKAQERAKVGHGNEKDISHWQGEITARVPIGKKFEGGFCSFSYTHSDDIRRYMMDNYSFADENGQGIEFVIAIYITPYHHSVTSTWVYYGYLIDDADN